MFQIIGIYLDVLDKVYRVSGQNWFNFKLGGNKGQSTGPILEPSLLMHFYNQGSKICHMAVSCWPCSPPPYFLFSSSKFFHI